MRQALIEYLGRLELSTILFGVIVAFLLFSLLAPLVGPDQATVTSRYTPSPPNQCIDSRPAPTPQELGETPITGTVRQVGNNPTHVEISYHGNGSGDISIHPQQGMKLVASDGFTHPGENTIGLGGSIGLTWNDSADSHWIRYRTEDEFPQGTNWLLAPIPNHDGGVTLKPATEGYIGPHVVYLGPYSTNTVSTGCQSITAILPKSSSLLLDAGKRLADLRFAANVLDTGHTYEEVRIFVSPESISGEPYGYNLKDTSTVLIEDFDPFMPNSIAWLHEYVHTHQGFREQPSATWYREATATYLSFRLALERERINPREYDMWLAFGENLNASASLTNSGYDSGTSYYRGAAVLSHVESLIWQANRTTIGDLARMLNEHSNPGQRDVKRFLLRRGNLTKQQVHSIHRQVSTTNQVSPIYVLGPKWLPATGRISVGIIGSGPGRRASVFFLGMFSTYLLANRFSQNHTLGLKKD